MGEGHPEILYKLQQLRAHELQQQATLLRLAAGYHQEYMSNWWQKIATIGTLLRNVWFLFPSQPKKPAPNCC